MKEVILPQLVAIGIFNAQLVLKDRTISKNRKTTMYEIELPIGEGGTSYIDDEVHPIKENTVICVKPGQVRHTRLPFKCYYIHMIVNKGLLSDMLKRLPNFIKFSNTDEIKKIFVSLCEHYNTGVEENALLLQSLILKLVYILSENSVSIVKYTPKSNNHKTIENTLQYIKDNLSSELTLEKLASVANFNAIYFHKLFKFSTGKTVREYVEEQRIKKSINMLISTNMTLTEIAYECGFSSQSYFSFAFKRRLGFSPREYAKKVVVRYNEV